MTAKKVKLSNQRQITILKAYNDELQLQKMPDDFAEQLLESLVAKGLSGQELLEKFKEASNNIGWTTFGAEKKDETI